MNYVPILNSLYFLLLGWDLNPRWSYAHRINSPNHSTWLWQPSNFCSFGEFRDPDPNFNKVRSASELRKNIYIKEKTQTF